MAKKALISIVVPLYNEEKRISRTVKELNQSFGALGNHFEVIFVNDGSLDNTLAVVEDIKLSIAAGKKIINLPKNQGKGAAVKKGVLAAKGDIIVLFDADGSTKIESLQSAARFLGDYDIIIGSRYLEGSKIVVKQSYLRGIFSRLGNLLVRTLLKLPYKDTQCGFKVLTVQAAKKIFERLTINRWGFDIEMLVVARKLGFKVKEMPVHWSDAAGSQLRAGKAAFSTFRELIKIWFGLVSGRYDAKD